MNQYRDLEQQIKAYADGQTPDLFDRLSEWEDRAETPIVLPLPRKRYALRTASLAACFVLLCGGLFVYLNRPKAAGLLAPQQSANMAGQAESGLLEEDDALEITDDCDDAGYDDIAPMEGSGDEAPTAGTPEAQQAAAPESAEPAPQAEDEPAVLLDEEMPLAGKGEAPDEGEPSGQAGEDLDSQETLPAQTEGLKFRSKGDSGEEAAASSAESGEDSAEMDPGYSFRPEKTEPETAREEEEGPMVSAASGMGSSGEQDGSQEKQEKSAPDEPAASPEPAGAAPKTAPGAETAGFGETADSTAPDEGTDLAQDSDVIFFPAGGNTQGAEDAMPKEETQGGEQLVDETNILRNLEAATSSKFAAQMMAPDTAPLAAEGEPAAPLSSPVSPEDGALAGEAVDGTAPPHKGEAPEARPDPAKELEAVLLETGVTKLAPAWLPDGFALERAYIISGDEPEDVKTGVAVYALPPAEEQEKADEPALDESGAPAENSEKNGLPATAENGTEPGAAVAQTVQPKKGEAGSGRAPARPSLVVSAKAQTEKLTVPVGEKWTVLAPGLEVLLHHEAQTDGDTVLQDEFTAVFTRDGYSYHVKGIFMEEESFLKAIRSIFEVPEA